MTSPNAGAATPRPDAKPCPFCRWPDTERKADFSTSLMVTLHYCPHCHSYFEAIKWGDRARRLDLPAFFHRTNP